RRRHTRSKRDWSSDVCSSDLRLYPRRVACKRYGCLSGARNHPAHEAPEQGWRVCSGGGQRGDALRAGPPISRLVAGTRLVVNVSDDEVKDGRIERSDATGLTVTSSGAWPYDVRSRS